MLFQSVILPCQYNTASTKTPVVQWWYKSYCRDRTQESFSPNDLGVLGSDLGAQAHLECSDASRTVRIVASGQGPSMTLAEHYKGRDIAIVDKSNLRIGKLQWGDSGVYFCKIVIPDDLEGKNEGQVELLVLGRTGERHDILPEFDVEIMPEWVFVGSVAVGMYEAGKMAKTGQPPQTLQPSQVPVYPYYIPGVPTLVPLAPPAHADPKMSSFPSIENNLAGASSLSELSSLHEGGNMDFRQTYQTVQMKALMPIEDLDDQSARRVAPPTQCRRGRRVRGNYSDNELDSRWNPRSEHLQRKTLSSRGRTGSLDELEEFARSYGGSRARQGEPRDRPSPSPEKRRRGTWDSDLRPPRPSDRRYNRGYDDCFLTSDSSRGKGSDCYYSRSPSNRPEEEDSLPPYSELEAERCRVADETSDRRRRYRTAEPPAGNDRYHRTVAPAGTERYRTADPANARPFSYLRPPKPHHVLPGGREEQDRNRNLSSALSRDTLIV
ncbi:hypothetical protein NHX12_006777 [Muraenolepis orangiensis]|uniref:Ig-like domain-containing protein n=1 Tax=Muraenolepis orangiensis TaxID=630683 RepID=A0A9Q0DMX3_9TELE|nr:hypothetical protein NHX12_006777 [Muraenolepis orangiensis]